MKRLKAGLIIPHPEDQKWDNVWKIFRFPNLTLPTLAALFPEEEWDIEIQDELVAPLDFTRGYDLVLITVTTSVAIKAYEVARIFRQAGAQVILGGIHPSALPQEAARHADAVVIGEAESVMSRLLEDFKNNRLAKFYTMPGMADRWDRRLPRWDLLDPKGYLFRESLTATRGCNYRCKFCSIHLALGGGQYGYRKKPVAEVVAILEKIHSPLIMFWDDDLLSDPRYTRELCQALRPLGKKWMSQMSATYVAQHPEMLKLLAAGGCSAMFMGLESVDQESLTSVNKQNSAKNYETLIHRIQAVGIDVHAGFVSGLDHEDVFSFERTVEWGNRVGLCGAIWRVLTPYPGTQLFEEFRRAGRLLTTDWTAYSGEHVVFRPARMTPEELYWGHKWAKRQFYSYRSIGQRMLRRAKLQGAGELLNTFGTGVGYRAMFRIPSQERDVDVYRDRKHLPPQPIPVAYRFPYVRHSNWKHKILNHLADYLPVGA
ncbi:MAG: B12-binding domain-containing radical SAM protein [Gammaproteobacteria bacterium]|nr:B12-binding domain-containing radical SAM protein [Gammaproteobacteria bacterium]